MYEKTINLLKNHTSIRKYRDETIPNEVLYEMIQAAQHAASSSFVQAYSIVRVTDPEKIEKLAELSKNPQQITSAPVVLLFCVDFKRLEYASQKHDVKLKADNLESFLVGTVDTALLAQNFVIAAESKGYGICYIGGVRNNPEQISDLVSLPDKVMPLFGMTVGVPDEEQYVKPRLPLEAVLHENDYDEEKYTDLIDQYDDQMRKYYATRKTNQKNVTWSEMMSNMLQNPKRPFMEEFVKGKGFLAGKKL
ncbi:oxygen-insensitive NADPH nitroreductase [Tenuibacillus multivorans]|uniref:Nitroreductase n=1 Tax=Tenuibacillus multivorans TaxID=237069 RepID=A0A1H0BYL1_9BACI|nr:oxygen-insensitive NADPH nitroreductase [Tenuibacillus multivorans]GEL78573.1 NADPH-dependent oxidoreductase [Tenuibacillus multivorans]SDN50724.1 Nitroreductase [Tenuibacillus multivorans]